MEEEEESFAFDVSQSAVKEQVLMGQIVLFDVKTDRCNPSFLCWVFLTLSHFQMSSSTRIRVASKALFGGSMTWRVWSKRFSLTIVCFSTID